MNRWIGSMLLVLVIGAAAVGCSDSGTGDEATTPPSATPTPSPPTASATEGPTGATGTTGATGPTGSTTTEWTDQQEAQAASIIADDIKHKFPLERRMAAGRCTVDELKTRRAFDSYDGWFAIWVQDEDPDALVVAMGVLEDCEEQVGIL